MVIKIFNTMTGKKEVFKPVEKGKVRIYVCGPTVYDYAHLGHARTYVAFDVIIRWLEFVGFDVFYVQNITDVGHLTEDTAEDKIIKRAREERIEPMQLVEVYMREYFKDMDLLGVRRPDVSPRATGHIVEIIEMIKTLVKKGYAYEVNGNVFYDISKFKDYGKLSRVKPEEMLAATRFEVHPDKRDPKDFALWKRAKETDLLKWPSPWGEGFPGWHIECSVMSTKYLGETFDIHGGAVDLIFPHHENEIAQGEAATGKQFVRYWMHTRFLTINGEKMAKSLGNFITVKEALEKWDPEVLKLFFASTHYRSQIDFSERGLKQAKESLERFYNTLDSIKALKSSKGKKLTGDEKKLEKILSSSKKRFEDAMNDDFNTPQALAVLFDLGREVNKFTGDHKAINDFLLNKIANTFKELGGIFGILQKERKVVKDLTRDLVELIIKVREEARKRGDWKTSDEIRTKLRKLGIFLEDQKKGTTWQMK